MLGINLLPLVQYVAGENITPARVLALKANTVQTVEMANDSQDLPFVGLSDNRYKYMLGSLAQAGVPYTAQTGDAVPYLGIGSVGWAVAGAAISDLSVPLTSDATGRVVSATLPPADDGQVQIVGYPIDKATAANQLIRVRVQPSTIYGGAA